MRASKEYFKKLAVGVIEGQERGYSFPAKRGKNQETAKSELLTAKLPKEKMAGEGMLGGGGERKY